MTNNEIFNELLDGKKKSLFLDTILERYLQRCHENKDLKSIQRDIEIKLGNVQKEIKLNKLFLEFLEEVKDDYK